MTKFRDTITAHPTKFGATTTPERAASLNQWVGRHNAAVRQYGETVIGPRSFWASSRILALGEAIYNYVESVEDWNEESFLDQYVADLIAGFRGLLNGDIGNLDGGILDAFACDMADRIGWDLDTHNRKTAVSR